MVDAKVAGSEVVDSEGMLSAHELIASHEQWKLTLWAAVFSRKPLTMQQVEQIVYPERCPIGRWLGAQAETELGTSTEYQAVVENHREFHEEMMEVAALLSRKDYAAASNAIHERSSFAECGRRLAQSILALNRVRRILAVP